MSLSVSRRRHGAGDHAPCRANCPRHRPCMEFWHGTGHGGQASGDAWISRAAGRRGLCVPRPMVPRAAGLRPTVVRPALDYPVVLQVGAGPAPHANRVGIERDRRRRTRPVGGAREGGPRPDYRAGGTAEHDVGRATGRCRWWDDRLDFRRRGEAPWDALAAMHRRNSMQLPPKTGIPSVTSGSAVVAALSHRLRSHVLAGSVLASDAAIVR
jgi:hypothetical protein